MKKYVDSCRTLKVLQQDSRLLPKPTEAWNTFEPQVGDIAYVSSEKAEYEFNGETWVRITPEITPDQIAEAKLIHQQQQKELERKVAEAKAKIAEAKAQREAAKAEIEQRKAQTLALRKQNKKSVEE